MSTRSRFCDHRNWASQNAEGRMVLSRSFRFNLHETGHIRTIVSRIGRTVSSFCIGNSCYSLGPYSFGRFRTLTRGCVALNAISVLLAGRNLGWILLNFRVLQDGCRRGVYDVFSLFAPFSPHRCAENVIRSPAVWSTFANCRRRFSSNKVLN